MRHLYYNQLPYYCSKLIQDLTLIISNAKQIHSQISMGGGVEQTGEDGVPGPTDGPPSHWWREGSSILNNCFSFQAQYPFLNQSGHTWLTCKSGMKEEEKKKTALGFNLLRENYFLRAIEDIRSVLANCCPVSKLKILRQSLLSFSALEQAFLILSAFLESAGESC